MNWIGKITTFILLLLLGTCLVVRRFPDETSNIDKVRKSNSKIQKSLELPKIPKNKLPKLKPWKQEIFYTLEEEIYLLCLGDRRIKNGNYKI